jgi:hypothetical protein
MTFDVRVIINTITLGLITWGFGIEENKDWKRIVGQALIGVGIIMNTISVFNT